MPEIRFLNENDKSAWKALWNDYLIFYKIQLPADVTACTWEKLINSMNNTYGLGAFDMNGELMGFSHYHFHESCWTKGPYCYMQDLFVHLECRGRGVGRALINAVYAKANDKGADQVYWLTEENNAQARHLYDQVGEMTTFIKYKKP